MNTQTPPSAQGKWGQPPRAWQPQKRNNRVRLLLFLGIALLLISTVLATASFYRGSTTLAVQVEGRQTGQINLNQSLPISPYLLGSNVFPRAGTVSKDQAGKGFMSYDQAVVDGLRSASIKLLRFPGGNWGEEHTPSVEQLNAFSALLNQVGAEGIMQAQLSNPDDVTAVPLETRVSRASLLVDYMNNSKSIQRQGTQGAFHPMRYWTVGNEPDLLVNPDTGTTYTVEQYTQAFIAYSLAMHQRDSHIKIFGPEISAYRGQQGPKDASGKLWMEEFLRQVSDYQHTHALPFRLLDGVSFHSYPFGDRAASDTALLSNPAEWDTLLPALRQFIRQQFGEDLPVALTEINTNSGKQLPAQPQAAVWWAETLGKLMSHQVEYVAFFSTEGVDNPYPLFTQNGLQQTAMLRTMQLFAHLQQNGVPFQGEHDPVGVYVTQDEQHTTVSLLLINKSADSLQVGVQADSFLPFGSWQRAHLTLPAYGMSVLTLHQNKSNEAYRFSNVENAQQAAPDIEHLVCTNNRDSILVC